ncbi:hypothetical protein DLM45_16435 [Hyphomicrobium methylovorum]|uniref:autotransporter domain-containing protein n=1 Tax=Hyphomicrobium methylovorum TaxID=84 RepID=UPI0015E6BB29|nr:autotransporter domain-containing protein [Hyphomicrobium methylovorum]MBA2127800.1 hypothetical protein [Hyphomicrobium methylovorum]
MLSFCVKSLVTMPRALRATVAPCAIVASLAMAVPFSSAARADCIEGAASTSDVQISNCDLTWQDVDVEDALNAQTAPHLDGTAGGTPWIAQRAAGAPVRVNSSDTGVSVRTSLDDVRSFNAQKASRSFSDPDATPSAIPLPKGPVRKSALDVWTNVDVNGYNGNTDQATRAGVGADYKLSRSATVGVSAERGDARTAASAATEADSKASAYVTLQAAPMLSLDARSQWQAGNAEFAAASGVMEKSSVTLSPKINHSFSLENGKTIEPYVSYKREFDVSTSGRETIDALAAERSAEAGIKYVSPDAYTLSVTTGVNGVGASESERSVNSKFQLSVPIN